MKKLLSLVLIGVMLMSFWGCGEKEEANESVPPAKEEEIINFDQINELEPENGVYRIHSVEGLLNMANHLDGKFELLRDIDLGGASWVPIGTKAAPFKGQVSGKEFTVKNFKIEAPTADGDMGFFGCNDGVIMQMNLADMTVTATKDTLRVGAMAGTNDGRIQRCAVAKATIHAEAMAAEAACGGAAGVNTGDIKNSQFAVDITCAAPGKASVGGLVGVTTDGEIRDTDAAGKLVISNGANKAVGLLAGEAKNVELRAAVFMGEDNRIDGKYFNAFIGVADNATTKDCLWRDNTAPELPADLRQIRNKVVQAMYDMGTVRWTVSQQINTMCAPNCTTGGCHYGRAPGVVYSGLPYTHGAGNLDRLMFCLDENNVIKDWVYDLGPLDGYTTYMGNSCYVAVQQAWATVANSMNVPVCETAIVSGKEKGLIPVGDWVSDWAVETKAKETSHYVQLSGEQTVLESYAKLRAGDAIIYNKTNGGHAIMAATDPVVVRDEQGLVDREHSYVYTHEQGASDTSGDTTTTWSIGKQTTFAYLLGNNYLPFTIRELLEGEKDIPEAHLEGGVEGVLGLTTGTVQSNFYLNSVTMKITNKKGKTVFEKTMFTGVDKMMVYNGLGIPEMELTKEYDLANFTRSVVDAKLDPKGGYHCTITAKLNTGDTFVVKDYSF